MRFLLFCVNRYIVPLKKARTHGSSTILADFVDELSVCRGSSFQYINDCQFLQGAFQSVILAL